MEGGLKIGSILKTADGNTIKVLKELGEGGQGYVYLIDYKNTKKALKWYKMSALGDSPKTFYDNLNDNKSKGTPSSEFLWPLDITNWKEGETFGYVMELIPEGFHELSEFMLCHVRFRSYKRAVDAAINIVSAFRILHNQGYSYQDLNDGNFFINPDDGNIVICDNDNVAPNGKSTGVLGKPRYMAPEIVLGKNMPNTASDLFSMSVILYILFCLNHPLEGKRYLCPGLSPILQEKLYGSEPLFMMDPDDKRNEPHPVIHKNSINVWKEMPDYICKLFLKAFSKDSLSNPAHRPQEIHWLKALVRFRSDIVACRCGNEEFTKDGRPSKCSCCGKMMVIPFRLDIIEYCIPAVPKSILFRCQLGICDQKDATQKVAQIVRKKETGALGIRNKTDKTWNAVSTKGENKKVKPEEVIPLKDGISFEAYDAKVIIRMN